MSDQTEALRLADALDAHQFDEPHAAAACLRRQHAEIQRLASEVVNRNRRAIEGDEAVAALSKVHAHYEGLEADRDALRAASQAIVDFVDGPAEAKRPDVFFLLINKLRAAIAKLGTSDE